MWRARTQQVVRELPMTSITIDTSAGLSVLISMPCTNLTNCRGLPVTAGQLQRWWTQMGRAAICRSLLA
jgi:hypothetical protein